MTYPLSFRHKVLTHIEEGMSKREAARLFKISPTTLYSWLGRCDLSPKKPVSRRGKIDKDALCRHVEDYPDALLRERAHHFGVTTNAIWEMMRKLGFVKKTDRLR